jgi:hypothetical protein
MKMIQQQLVDYILQSLNKGYRIEEIRDYLLQNGYNISIVNENIVYAQKMFSSKYYSSNSVSVPVHTTHHLGKTTIITIITVSLFFIVSLIFSLIFFINGSNKYLLDNTITLSNLKINQGELLIFDNYIKNEGKEKAYDINIKYEITRNSDGKNIYSEIETKAIKTEIKEKKIIPLDIEEQPGRYTLTISISYGNIQQTAPAQKVFEIVEKKTEIKPSCNDGIKNQDETGIDCGGSCNPCDNNEPCIKNSDCKSNECDNNICILKENNISCICEDDGNPCTKNYCNSLGECISENILGCCFGDNCNLDKNEEDKFKDPATYTQNDIINKLKSFDNHVKAAEFCQILVSAHKDYCMGEVAIMWDRIDMCDYIESEYKSSNCYFSFIKKTKDYSKCELIKNKYLREGCEQLKNWDH